MEKSKSKSGLRQKEILAVVVLLMLAVLVIIVLKRSVIDSYLKVFVVKTLSFQLKSDITIDKLDVSIFPPKIKAKGIVIDNIQGGKSVLIAGAADVSFSPFPIFLRKIIVSNIELDSLALITTVKDLETLNLPVTKQNSPYKGSLLNFQINRIHLKDFDVTVKDTIYTAFSKFVEIDGEFSKGRGTLKYNGNAKLLYRDKNLEFDTFRGEIDLKRNDVSIKEMLLVSGKKFSINIKGDVAPKLRLSNTIEVDPNFFTPLIPEMISAEGKLKIPFMVEGEYPNLRYSGEITSNGMKFKGMSFDRIKIGLTGSKDRVILKSSQIDVEKSKVLISGEVNLTKRPSLIKTVLSQIDIERIAKNLRLPTTLKGYLNGTMNLKFSSLNPFLFNVDMEGQVDDLTVSSRKCTGNCPNYNVVLQEPLGVKALAQYRGKGNFFIEEISLKNENLDFFSKGNYSLYDKSFFEYQLVSPSLNFINFNNNKIYGSINTSGTYDLSRDSGTLEGVFLANDISSGTNKLGSLSTSYTLRGNSLELDKFSWNQPNGKLFANMRFDFEDPLKLSVSANLNNFEIGNILRSFLKNGKVVDSVDGGFTGNVNINGAPKQLTGFLALTSENLTILKKEPGTLNIKANIIDGDITIGDLSLTEGSNQTFSASGYYDLNGKADLLFAGKSIDIEVVEFGKLKKFLGDSLIDFDVAYKKDASGDSLSGDLQLREKKQLAEGENILETSFNTDFVELTSQGKYMGGKVFYDLNMELKKDRNLSLSIVSKDFDFTDLLSKKMTLNSDEVDGLLSMNANVIGKLGSAKTFKGNIDIEQFAIWKKDIRIEALKGIKLNLAGGKYSVPQFSLTGTDTNLNVEAEGELDGHNIITVKGLGNLGMLSIFFKEFIRAEGKVELDGTIEGPLNDLSIIGRGRLSEGLLAIRDFPNVIQSIESDLTFSHKIFLLDNIKGIFGGGNFAGSGTMEIGDWDGGLFFDASVEIENASSRFPLSFPGVVSGTLTFRGPYRVPTLGGDLTVHSMRYSEPWEWRSKLISFGKYPTYTGSATDQPEVYLDVHVAAEKPVIEIKNNVTDSLFTGDIHIVGSDKRVGVLGDMKLYRGKVYFLDKEFELTDAHVKFIDEEKFLAMFDVSGTTTVKDTEIYLQLRGTSDHPEVLLSSSPAKSETDIVMLLTLGVDSTELASGGGSQDGLSQSLATSILSGGVQETVEQTFRKAKLLDTFQVYPSFSEESRSTELRMTVGRDIPYDMKILYSTDIYNIGTNQEVKLKKGITEAISVQGIVKDKVNQRTDLGLDLEFNIDF